MFLLFAFDRVHQLVDFLQLHDAHVRVPLRAFQTGVAEHPLDETDVCSVFHLYKLNDMALF